jgi:2-polyprenyl-3-methyl-5-hydroxy-6-metoxy-1,4-benzoquinol methylase
MNPLWPQRIIEKFYQEGYYSGKGDYTYHDERGNYPYEKIVWRARLKQIRKFIPNGHFCDVGCSFGGFLTEASVYFKPYGVEISEYAARSAKEKNPDDIFNGELENVPWQSESMDIITAIEVMEHIKNPKSFLKKAGDLLRPGGLLVIQTADFDGWQAVQGGKNYHYFMPGHLHYYTADNLKKILRSWAGIDRIIEYRGTDFGLLPKILKSRGSFSKWWHYFRWWKIIIYHLKSKVRWRGRYLTSAMVLYAFKKDKTK